MITIVYYISPEAADEERDWLREQKIFPAMEKFWDWGTDKDMVRVGVIVGNEQALTLKLRHTFEVQKTYTYK